MPVSCLDHQSISAAASLANNKSYLLWKYQTKLFSQFPL